MKIDSSDLRFDANIAALAMPKGNVLSAAAEGISNIGKAALDEEKRQRDEKLTDLQMRQAEQGIKKGDIDMQLSQKQLNDYDTDKALQRRNLTTQVESGELDLGIKKKTKADSDALDAMKSFVTSSGIDLKDPKAIEGLRGELLKQEQFKGREYVINDLINNLSDDAIKRKTSTVQLESAEVSLDTNKEQNKIQKLFGSKKAQAELDYTAAQTKHLQEQDGIGWYNAKTSRINAENSASGSSGGYKMPAGSIDRISANISAVRDGVNLALSANEKNLGIIDNFRGFIGGKIGTNSQDQATFIVAHNEFLRKLALANNKGALTDKDYEWAVGLLNQSMNVNQYRAAVNKISSSIKNNTKELARNYEDSGYDAAALRQRAEDLDKLFVKRTPSQKLDAKDNSQKPKFDSSINYGTPKAAAPAPAQQHAEGTIIRAKDGRRMVMKNGQWVPVK